MSLAHCLSLPWGFGPQGGFDTSYNVYDDPQFSAYVAKAPDAFEGVYNREAAINQAAWIDKKACLSQNVADFWTVYSDTVVLSALACVALAVALVLFRYRRQIAVGFYWLVVRVSAYVVGNARAIGGRFSQDVNEHTPR